MCGFDTDTTLYGQSLQEDYSTVLDGKKKTNQKQSALLASRELPGLCHVLGNFLSAEIIYRVLTPPPSKALAVVYWGGVTFLELSTVLYSVSKTQSVHDIDSIMKTQTAQNQDSPCLGQTVNTELHSDSFCTGMNCVAWTVRPYQHLRYVSHRPLLFIVIATSALAGISPLWLQVQTHYAMQPLASVDWNSDVQNHWMDKLEQNTVTQFTN